MLEIAPANEDENSGRLIIQRDQRALQIIGRHRLVRHGYLFRALEPTRVNVVGRVTVTGVFLGFREMRSQRFLSDPLHFRIDRRVDPVTFIHRPVPADGGDDLLPDVIDRVGLALRALPAADRDLFRLRGFAALAPTFERNAVAAIRGAVHQLDEGVVRVIGGDSAPHHMEQRALRSVSISQTQ